MALVNMYGNKDYISGKGDYMQINLNDPVKVKLTDYGISIYYHRFDTINYKAGRTVCEPSYPKVDKDGYTEFQLWDFMSIYGSYMKMGEPNVICPLEIIFSCERRMHES